MATLGLFWMLPQPEMPFGSSQGSSSMTTPNPLSSIFCPESKCDGVTDYAGGRTESPPDPAVCLSKPQCPAGLETDKPSAPLHFWEHQIEIFKSTQLSGTGKNDLLHPQRSPSLSNNTISQQIEHTPAVTLAWSDTKPHLQPIFPLKMENRSGGKTGKASLENNRAASIRIVNDLTL